MQITLLGTGSPLPDPLRAGPATLVRAAGSTILVDCGRGVLMRLAGAGVLPPMLSAVLVTHLHSDHLTDLNDVITTHWVMNPQPVALSVFGPPGLRGVVDATLSALAPDIRYRLAHHTDLTEPPNVDVTEMTPGDQFDFESVAVRVAATDHRPVEPTVAYRIEGDGRSVVVGGDGVPCVGLDELCHGADAYVQTVIRSDLVRQVPNTRFQDIIDYHSTVEDAARTAARAEVRTLVLTHYVPPMAPAQADEWRALAARHFAGDIVLGDDLTTVDL
ncbi:MAG TPA: ribonuclease Z [Acidimicrobiia bacterium]|nr:ribonuclease Z [Acidimicrobiia bacterium]